MRMLNKKITIRPEEHKANSIPQNIPLFTLQGGFDRSKLQGMDKLLISMLKKGLSAQKQHSAFVIEKIKTKSGKITDMTPSSITNKFSMVFKKAGLPNFRFHDLRHYAESTLHAINVPDKYIMARGGWATNYTMNNVYNHTLRSKQDAFELKINSHFKTLVEDETV